jgi:hypothetical protein
VDTGLAQQQQQQAAAAAAADAADPSSSSHGASSSSSSSSGGVVSVVSFYTLPSSVLGHEEHKELRAAYMFYSGEAVSCDAVLCCIVLVALSL